MYPSYLIFLDNCRFQENYHSLPIFSCISLKFHITWYCLASVNRFFLRFYLLFVQHNNKLMAFVSIRVFCALISHSPDRMVASKIDIFFSQLYASSNISTCTDDFSFMIHNMFLLLFFLSPYISVFSSKTATITCSSYPCHLIDKVLLC